MASSTVNEVDRRTSKDLILRCQSQIHSAMHGQLSSKFQSWDYDTCENSLLKDEEKSQSYTQEAKKAFLRWFIMVIVGVLTGLFSCGVELIIEKGAEIKFTLLQDQIYKCVNDGCLPIPILIWVTINVGLVLIASILVTYVEPVAAGSGIPQLKCYLNGLKIPGLFRLKTFVLKTIAVVCSVLGDLAVGKEPAVTNAGGFFAAGVSQGMLPSFNTDFGLFKYFREDREKRDFVSGGAAIGVGAAFAAPMGGLLFSLEEGASFWNQGLTWRMLLGSLVAVFTMNTAKSFFNGHLGDLSYSMLVDFGSFEDKTKYSLVEIPVFVLIGAVGGLLGALYNCIFYKLALLRIRIFKGRKHLKVAEVALVSAVTACAGMLMLYYTNDCKPLDADTPEAHIQMFCEEGEYTTIGSFWFQTPEGKVRSMFHEPKASHSSLSLLAFSLFYFFLSCYTMGLSTGSGLYLPCLLIGGAWGRLVGKGMELLFPGAPWLNAGKYATLGGAAQLGGVLRMTVCLTLIVVEGTSNLTLALPVMVTLNVAKWVGDCFNEGFYDICIDLMRAPIIGWEPPPLSRHVTAREVMSSPVVTLPPQIKAEVLREILKRVRHSGYPVVDTPGDGVAFGRFKGVILRHQLTVLLNEKLFEETKEEWRERFTLRLFREYYPKFPVIEDITLSDEEKEMTIDLRPVMNVSSYSVPDSGTLPRIFTLFRGLGLRHLIVVNANNEVVGIVTRIDLARYRFHSRFGRTKLSKLPILQESW